VSRRKPTSRERAREEEGREEEVGLGCCWRRWRTSSCTCQGARRQILKSNNRSLRRVVVRIGGGGGAAAAAVAVAVAAVAAVVMRVMSF